MADKAELRLALVCYGGVSLAVYMHGVTKELHKLIRAAREFDKNPDKNPFTDGGTEAVYFDTLTDLAKAGHRLVLSIDIIGGTSAGGINGIALAKALACNSSLEPLKKVWIDDGDIRKLLTATRWLPAVLQRALPLTLQAVAAVADQLVKVFGSSSPLSGAYMSQLLYKALDAMEIDRLGDGSLLPNESPKLELYVPTTDLSGFDVLVASGAGGASNRDRDYRQTLVFSGEGENLDQFGSDYTAALAFAGRASSSFPGAFAPVSPGSFQKEIKPVLKATDGKGADLHSDTVFLCQYQSGAENVNFVDGGVLDNAPFDLVIDAIARRPAQMRVHRQLIYVEPDPGVGLYDPIDNTHEEEKRRYLKDLQAVWGVRGSHPILADLTRLRDLNWRIAEVRAISKEQENFVEAETRTALANVWQGPAADPGLAAETRAMTTNDLVQEMSESQLKAASNELYSNAETSLKPVWPTYLRLRFEEVLKRLSDEIAWNLKYPGPSGKAGFIKAAWIEWARREGAWTDLHLLRDWLDAADMPYRERRLLFIIAGINDMYDAANEEYPAPPAADLDGLKEVAWGLLARIRAGAKSAVADMTDGVELTFLRIDDNQALDNPENFATNDANAKSFGNAFTTYFDKLKDYRNDSDELREAFESVTSKGWDERAKEALLSRYLGFPLWDGMLFPTISLTELPQLSQIPVSQFSPLTAKALLAPIDDNGKLRPPPTKDDSPAKLKGIAVKHFAAFFDAEFRENDYLWGRLDGAEQILRMLASYGPGPANAPLPRLADALTAVLDTETDLKRVKSLREYLYTQIATLDQTATATT